jgi:NADH-quinone oxidoreductase subunit N
LPVFADTLSSETIRVLVPELIVVLAATFIYLAGAFLPNKKFWAGVGLAALVAAGFALVGQYERLFWPEGAKEPILAAAVGGPLAVDLLAVYVRLLALVVGGVFVLLAARPANDELVPEVVGTVMMAVAGLMLVGAARDLTLLFLGLELISIPTYILLFLGRRDGASAESTAKYFFLSILSSGITLYGFSFLYGVGGSTRLDAIQAALAKGLAVAGSAPLYAQLALVLVTAGLGFKIAAVPFHFYAPDVYQGTTHANAALLAVLPKIAGIAALIRIVSVALPGTEDTGIRVLLILALLTMTLGNLVALWQDDIRRMMAYSSIAQAGYMLVGLAVDFAARKANLTGVDGIGATLFYVAAYSFASAGAFAAFAYMGGRARSIDRVDDLAGLGRACPFAAICAAIFLFSLAGLPPFPGFWAKFAVFSGAVKVGLAGEAAGKLSGWFIFTAVVGMLNAAVSAAYYLRLIGAMYFRPNDAVAKPTGAAGPRLAMILCVLISLWISFGPGPLSTASNGAAKSARSAPPAVPAPAQQASR